MRPRGRPPDLLWQHYVPKEPCYAELLYQLDPKLPRLQLTLTLRLSVYHQKALQYPPTHDKARAPLGDARLTIIRLYTYKAALQHLAMLDEANAGSKVNDFVSEPGT